MRIGAKIFEQRKAINLTQSQLAEQMGVTFQTVSLWERDQTVPELEKIIHLSKVLQMPIKELLTEDDDNITKDWECHDKFFSEDSMYTFVKSAAAARGYNQTQKALPLMKEK